MRKKNLYFPPFSVLIKNPIHFLAFGLGSGLIRPAPGTWGSLLGALLLFPCLSLLRQNPLITTVLLVLSFFLGCFFCGKTADDLQTHDHSGIVWDEFVGVWMVMLAAPEAIAQKMGSLMFTGLCFLLFRLFDISKPPPISWLDKNTKGGFGIMIDDIAAALFALIPLWIYPSLSSFF